MAVTALLAIFPKAPSSVHCCYYMSYSLLNPADPGYNVVRPQKSQPWALT